MDLRFSPAEEAFRELVRSYLSTAITLQLLQETDQQADPEERGLHARAFVKKLAEDGWLGLSWPKEYGGQGKSPLEQYIFLEELWHEGVALMFPYNTIFSVGPTLMRVGSHWQKQEFIPPILRGELEVALGYTEAEAGNDLASLQTRATRDGDDYVIKGQKFFTSKANIADYIWLAARTNPDAPKHKGISLFLVSTKLPGYSYQPVDTWAGVRTYVTFYDNVRVPDRFMVGEENRGWEYLGVALDYQRVTQSQVAPIERDLESLIRWAKETQWGGRPVSKDPWVQDTLADLTTQLEAARVFCYRNIWLINKGEVPYVEASMAKVFCSELALRVAHVGLQMMGMYGLLEPGSKWAPLKGLFERSYRYNSFALLAPGANEIHRDIIGYRGLGLPRE